MITQILKLIILICVICGEINARNPQNYMRMRAFHQGDAFPDSPLSIFSCLLPGIEAGTANDVNILFFCTMRQGFFQRVKTFGAWKVVRSFA